MRFNRPGQFTAWKTDQIATAQMRTSIDADNRADSSFPANRDICTDFGGETVPSRNCYKFRNSHLPISQDATVRNTSMIAVGVKKMAVGNGSSPPSVRFSLAGLPET